MYHESYTLHPYNDFAQDGPNIWRGYFGPYTITITQKHRHHDIEEDDVVVDKDPAKEDSDIIYAYPAKGTIAKALNEHLDRIYD